MGSLGHIGNGLQTVARTVSKTACRALPSPPRPVKRGQAERSGPAGVFSAAAGTALKSDPSRPARQGIGVAEWNDLRDEGLPLGGKR